MLDQTVLSERRACRLAGLSRDAFRHPPEPTPATQALSARIIELAQVRRRFGYRRLHDLLRPKFPDVNHKKVYRLYSEASLAVRRNGYIESFNGKFRDECLNEHWFTSLAQARQVIADWRRDYNEVRPHSSCGRIPPAQFAANHRAQQANNAVTFNPGLYQ